MAYTAGYNVLENVIILQMEIKIIFLLFYSMVSVFHKYIHARSLVEHFSKYTNFVEIFVLLCCFARTFIPMITVMANPILLFLGAYESHIFAMIIKNTKPSSYRFYSVNIIFTSITRR